MIVVKPSVEVLAYTQLPPSDVRPADPCSDLARVVERCGRVSWKSEDKMGPGTAEGFMTRVVNIKKDFSIAEHASVTMLFVTDRYVTHQLVRHRIAAYTQESTHYINYAKEKFGGHIAVCEPLGMQKYSEAGLSVPEREFPLYEEDALFTADYLNWYWGCIKAEKAFFDIMARGKTKHYHARYVLPSCLKTEIAVTYNLRMWLHVLRERTTPNNTPEIALLLKMAGRQMARLCPEMFGEWK